MFKGLLTAAALLTIASNANAGTLQNGVWTSTCAGEPGPAPEIKSNTPDAYNKSAPVAAAWSTSAKAYYECVKAEIQADQSAMIDAVNTKFKALSAEIEGVNNANTAAIEKLKAKSK
jgi:hypothetical protein